MDTKYPKDQDDTTMKTTDLWTHSTPYFRINQFDAAIVVRPFRFSDYSKCKAAHKGRHAKVDRFDSDLPQSKCKDIESFRERVIFYRKNARDQIHFVFGIFTKTSGEFVGQVDIFVINRKMRWGNLGYQIHNQYWGNGYATAAAKLALNIAFRELNFHRIEAAIQPENKASVKVAKNAGLIFEGKRKNFIPDHGGVDCVIFGANAFDFKKRRAKTKRTKLN